MRKEDFVNWTLAEDVEGKRKKFAYYLSERIHGKIRADKKATDKNLANRIQMDD